MSCSLAYLLELRKWGDVKESVCFRDITTIRIGGKIACFFVPNDLNSLQKAMIYLQEHKVAVKLIGRGSDLVCGDEIFEGCVIRLDKLNHVEINDETVTVGAGALGMALSKRFAKEGLAGFEFASAIPGSIGGMTFMNAGAYKSSMSEVLQKVRYIDNGELKEISVEECQYGYRSSIFQKNPHWIIVEVVLMLRRGDSQAILQLMEERSVRRQSSQPLDKPSAGSCFCNPESDFSWRYIEGVGMRGYTLGGIQVSDKHPNFIVNIGNATAKEFLEVTSLIQRRVKEKYGISLRREIELFNCHYEIHR